MRLSGPTRNGWLTGCMCNMLGPLWMIHFLAMCAYNRMNFCDFTYWATPFLQTYILRLFYYIKIKDRTNYSCIITNGFRGKYCENILLFLIFFLLTFSKFDWQWNLISLMFFSSIFMNTILSNKCDIVYNAVGVICNSFAQAVQPIVMCAPCCVPCHCVKYLHGQRPAIR